MIDHARRYEAPFHCMGANASKALAAELAAAGETVELQTTGCATGGCIFMGTESDGLAGSLRGNCTMALTDKRLKLKGIAVPDWETPVPELRSAELTHSYPSGRLGADIVIKIGFGTAGDFVYVVPTVGTGAAWVDAINRAAALHRK